MAEAKAAAPPAMRWRSVTMRAPAQEQALGEGGHDAEEGVEAGVVGGIESETGVGEDGEVGLEAGHARVECEDGEHEGAEVGAIEGQADLVKGLMAGSQLPVCWARCSEGSDSLRRTAATAKVMRDMRAAA